MIVQDILWDIYVRECATEDVGLQLFGEKFWHTLLHELLEQFFEEEEWLTNIHT